MARDSSETASHDDFTDPGAAHLKLLVEANIVTLLDIAESHVAEAEQNVGHQQRLLSEFIHSGDKTGAAIAREVLTAFENSLKGARRIRDLRRLNAVKRG